ncbi:O-antigen ligase family protein [Lachnoclostridium phytofermentans]|uniref:O-antigen polymerase n=1 Tax=Lachnoclostridium phytofermentans (strain ATCC 700394 / DSM 18823 / ISDg) TaxID=357809 RepID=A9KI00_LACP7|nr:O-antigen ligase family protein [Lachnoclostridium phytofermentans]ABX43847.1 O-antigen polymerase [Lachnoclostridium phytofermentans ISDg]
MKIFNNIFSLRHITAKLLFILVFSSTFYSILPDKIDTVIIFLPQLVLCLLALYILYKFFKKEYISLKTSKRILNLTLFLFFYYLFLCVYRYFTGGNAIQSFYHVVTLFSAIVFYFLIETEIQNIRDIHFDVLFIITLINILQVIVSIYLGSIRFSFVLQNIMVYISCANLMVPFLFYILRYSKKNVIKYLSIINLIIIFIANIASGSRTALVIVLLSFIISIIINIDKSKKFICQCAIILSISISLIAIFYKINYMDIRTSILRQTITYIDKIPSNNTTTSTTNEPENNSSNDDESYKQYVLEGINSSNSVRSDLWNKSFSEISKDPLFGTGNIVFETTYLDQIVMQGSHNFILESILIFGSIGGILYLIILVLPVISIVLYSFKNKVKIRLICTFILSLGSLFIIALVQPILTTALPIMLFWILNSIVFNSVSENK